ncbi:alpha-L-fucosidase [Pilibacter termitis]|uniref:alpha-L-fucosidase n=1 Tax=Pilibacter termitis TaxID=263852 RepID=A0A1T4MAP8_9ENTE|nr:alpha-L-fucosidase [Pilibacter termitis]SJZ63926.1 alpha-L-fucosidase [Pilibacter termitis]
MSEIREDIVESIDAENEEYGELADNIKEKLEWFQDQKIGVIFHWGLYAEAGIVESWQLSEEDDWARKKPWREDLQQLRNDYWGLNKVFNPVKFDPDDWAEKCKQAGFRYVIFSTKHHDGFNMYDTKESDYKITNEPSPFCHNPKADTFGEVMKAFRKAGLGTGAYYSKADWHCPYYWVPNEHAKGRQASYSPKKNPEMWAKFERFVKNQLLEICRDYGNIDILWLDAGWVNMREEMLDMPDIVGELRKTQPDMLVVDRTIGGEFENYVTPERKVPDVAPKKVWESNLPLAKNWGYVPNDIYKPFDELLASILKIISMGGNVILGVGPKPDGTLPDEAVAIMEKLGEFLSTFGEGIYNTRAAKITQEEDWYFTENEEAIFAFALAKKESATLSLEKLQKHYEIGEILNLRTKENVKIENNQVVVNFDEKLAVGLKINKK